MGGRRRVGGRLGATEEVGGGHVVDLELGLDGDDGLAHDLGLGLRLGVGLDHGDRGGLRLGLGGHDRLLDHGHLDRRRWPGRRREPQRGGVVEDRTDAVEGATERGALVVEVAVEGGDVAGELGAGVLERADLGGERLALAGGGLVGLGAGRGQDAGRLGIGLGHGLGGGLARASATAASAVRWASTSTFEHLGGVVLGRAHRCGGRGRRAGGGEVVLEPVDASLQQGLRRVWPRWPGPRRPRRWPVAWRSFSCSWATAALTRSRKLSTSSGS